MQLDEVMWNTMQYSIGKAYCECENKCFVRKDSFTLESISKSNRFTSAGSENGADCWNGHEPELKTWIVKSTTNTEIRTKNIQYYKQWNNNDNNNNNDDDNSNNNSDNNSNNNKWTNHRRSYLF